MKSQKQLIVVGDRVLIKPDSEKDKTSAGLYLPQGVETKEKVQGGWVVKVGPGYPLPDPGASEEPWDKNRMEPKYLPLRPSVPMPTWMGRLPFLYLRPSKRNWAVPRFSLSRDCRSASA